MDRKTKIYIATALLPALLLVSIAAYLIHPAKYVRRSFFFPETLTRKTVSISRYIPAGRNRGENIKYYIKDLALGPHVYTCSSIIPPEGEINSVIYRDRSVYIDFSREMAFLDEGSLSDENFGLIGKNISYNFPFVRRICFTIDGQPVSAGIWVTE